MLAWRSVRLWATVNYVVSKHMADDECQARGRQRVGALMARGRHPYHGASMRRREGATKRWATHKVSMGYRVHAVCMGGASDTRVGRMERVRVQ